MTTTTSTIKAKQFKRTQTKMAAPFDYMEVDVVPVVYSGHDEPIGHSVSVMDGRFGEGVRMSLEYAEAYAAALQKVTRAYRRKNRAVFDAAAQRGAEDGGEASDGDDRDA